MVSFQAITSGIFVAADNDSLVVVLLDSRNFEEVTGLLLGLESVCLPDLLSVAVGPSWAAKTRNTVEGSSRILLDIRQVCNINLPNKDFKK